MKLIRSVEEGIASRYSKQMRCLPFVNRSERLVQQLVLFFKTDQAGITVHMLTTLAKGDIKALAEIYGKSTAAAEEDDQCTWLIVRLDFGSTAIVGNTIPVGVGIGFRIKYRKMEICCVFLETLRWRREYFMSCKLCGIT